jgi:DNA-binding transcriptional LysR family regulator
MRSFARVARASSFTAAARQLGFSRAIVSRHVADLEARLRVRLLDRSTRHVRLTEEGRAYLLRCERLLTEIEALDDAIAARRAQPTGTIRVHAPKSFGTLVLADAVIAFAKAQPDIRTSLLLGDFTFRPYDFVEHGLDIGIRLSPLRDSSLIARRIGTVDSVLCAAPGFLAREGPPAGPDDLARLPCLAHLNLAPNDRAWTLLGPKGARTVDIGGPFFSNSAVALRKAALAGIGIAMLPGYCVRDDLAAGALVRVLPDFRPPARPILAVRPRSAYVTEKVKLFVDFLARWFRPRAGAAIP